MSHYIIWHDNGDKTRTAQTCGYTEEESNRTEDEIRTSYEKSGCTVFDITKISSLT